MGFREVGLAAAVVLLSCGERSGEARTAAPGAGEGAAPADRASERPPSLERGDRHARAAARRSLVVKRVEGTLSRVGERQVVIRRRGGPELSLRVSPRTKVTMNGRPAGLERLREGAEVRAAYQTGDGGRPTALSIEAQSAPGPESGGRWKDEPVIPGPDSQG
ncbi:MAG TPA: hypothetical protein VIV57_24840 [Anaeromyxobacter sp.]